MSFLAVVDTEIDPGSGRIQDIGSVKSDGSTFHKASIVEFKQFLYGVQWVCGHNLFNHDLKYIGAALNSCGLDSSKCIDTLYFSPLLFPTRPYHKLLKDDKLQTEETNNPLNDAIKARELFIDEVAAFQQIPGVFKQILFGLLKGKKEFHAFFDYLSYQSGEQDIAQLIRQKFHTEMCERFELTKTITEHPIELAYALSLVNAWIENKNSHSITPPWVLKNYPGVQRILFNLRSKPCVPGCNYCNKTLDIHKGIKRYFGFDTFRTYGGEPLQEKAVEAAVRNKSILAVFPTGGGKSITFQIPALMCGESVRGLTIVISPLQSLMKDQVDNLERIGITEAVTINGMLDPIERAKSIERVENGSASILYLSPESLRSTTIERLIKGRKIARFVIDEAHCFSSWGQDFRADYLYIGDFIKKIQEAKNLEIGIPVSCFTATAKQKVIEDIRTYFKDKLDLNLELFTSKESRKNLFYRVIEKNSEEEKYAALRDIIEEKECPIIIYVSRTQKATVLAERLTADGFHAKPYHGKMDVIEKTTNQNAFISGQVSIMVATSAFGMGVDKKDVGMVIHYEIADSLENYVQEAGRAGRDEKISAECFVLYNEEDLNKHFILLNQTKLSIQEIQQIWKAIKEITRFRSSVSNSALEIARKAGWDDRVVDIETRVTTAIAALEDAGYLKRGQNMPRIFANSILSRNAQEAIDKIGISDRFKEKQKENAIRIIKKLFSSKSRKHLAEETAETRVDYLSDHLGIPREEVINIVQKLREEKILADAKDLSAFIRRGEQKNQSLQIVKDFGKIEMFLTQKIEEQERAFHVKELNEQAENFGCEKVSTNRIKTVLNYWAIKNWIKIKRHEYAQDQWLILAMQSKEKTQDNTEKRLNLALFMVEFLHGKTNRLTSEEGQEMEEILVEFSVQELKEEHDKQRGLFDKQVTVAELEDALFYLTRIDAIKIEGGFLVLYNRLMIERVVQNNQKQYKKEDYEKLRTFYNSKIEQIHIVGEYARKMMSDYKDALQFVEDYFHLNYDSFLQKYFKGSRRDEIRRNITPQKFAQLFGELSPTQLKIINDKEAKYIVVAAGPGSGKTRVLVHKLASLLLMEDVKHEQLLMLTFSRAAATEFKKRLMKLIGNAALYIEIKTFHSYCFDLMGRVGSLDKSEAVVRTAVEKIKNREVEMSKVTKSVLVIDEAQDMDEHEFELIKTLMSLNEEMRVIAVGDDDQNIYEFRGSSAKYFGQLIKVYGAVPYEMIENYRSRRNLVEFTNQFVVRIRDRLKTTPIIPIQSKNGTIKLTRYFSGHLITPLLSDVLTTDRSGSTCVLTNTNDDAMQIAGMLMNKGIPAKLIQSNDGFSLFNLSEIRFFLYQLMSASGDWVVIDDEVWDKAKRETYEYYQNSTKLELCKNVIKDFEATHPKRKYKTDLDLYIRESRMEDFFNASGETVFVSTIHKSKGREFDRVFLMLDNFNTATEESKRLAYVAMTRAKEHLTIHTNSGFLDNLKLDAMENVMHTKIQEPRVAPNEIYIQLTHKDIWLDFFSDKQTLVSALMSGDTLAVNAQGCATANGQTLLTFSQQFVGQLARLGARQYNIAGAKVNFVVYWLKEGAKEEIQIVLPELYLKKG